MQLRLPDGSYAFRTRRGEVYRALAAPHEPARGRGRRDRTAVVFVDLEELYVASLVTRYVTAVADLGRVDLETLLNRARRAQR